MRLRRHAIYVGLLLAAGLAALLNRTSLPPWMLPELYNYGFVAGLESLNLRQSDILAPVSVKGRETVLIADSMGLLSPWDADRITVHNTTAQDLCGQMDYHLRGRQYDTILLWPGTFQLWHGDGIEPYLEGVACMIARAKALNASNIVLIGPMPYGPEQREQLVAYYAKHLPEADPSVWLPSTERLAVEAVAGVRELDAGISVVGLSDFQQDCVSNQESAICYRDGLHLTKTGFQTLNAYLTGRGVALPADLTAEES